MIFNHVERAAADGAGGTQDGDAFHQELWQEKLGLAGIVPHHWNGKEQRINAVEYASVAGQKCAGIFYSRAAFQRRLKQVTELRRDVSHDAKSNYVDRAHTADRRVGISKIKSERAGRREPFIQVVAVMQHDECHRDARDDRSNCAFPAFVWTYNRRQFVAPKVLS